jgi:hypothetical protein
VSKAGMIGLCNVAAVEGAGQGVKCNLIIPAAVTRMAEGIDISAYPPMSPELVAPAVGWLAHEVCSVSGEMLVSIAGRVARAFVAESQGVYRPSWSIDQINDHIGTIRDTSSPVVFSPVPDGFPDHIRYSFEMTNRKAGSA